MGSIKDSKSYFVAKSFLRTYYRMYVKWVRKVDPRFKARGTGGTISARYCYSVFMRHMVRLFQAGMSGVPRRVAEFGPGDSIGIGLCAILAGAREYYALDVVEYANSDRNLKIFDELLALFKDRAPIPDDKEFPKIRPLLEDYSFPSHIFSENEVEENISEKRIGLIRKLLMEGAAEDVSDDVVIRYIVPWENYQGDYPEVDFVFSQAVLEHVDHLENLYQVMNQILISGGYASHDIDFKSHGETYEWNGHWAITDAAWEKVRGGRPYLINREPLSTHLQLFEKSGFEIIRAMPCLGSGEDRPSIPKKKLASRFKNMTADDFETASCYVIAKKTGKG